MTREQLPARGSIDPAGVCRGQPCIRGIRVLVVNVLDALAAGLTTSEITEQYLLRCHAPCRLRMENRRAASARTEPVVRQEPYGTSCTVEEGR